MFLDGVIKTLRAPFEFVRTRVFGVKTIKNGIKGDIQRLKGVKNEYQDAAGKAGEMAKKAKAPKNGKNGKQKMGLFSKKKKCPSCGEKLHASWDQCPYCGWSEAAGAGAGAAPAAASQSGGGGGGGGGGGSPKMRTVARGAPARGGATGRG